MVKPKEQIDEDKVAEIITKLTWWEYNQATEEEFVVTFGERTGKDFWIRYDRGEGLLDLWGKMDTYNRTQLVKRILHHYS